MDKQTFVSAAVISLILRQMVGQRKSVVTLSSLFHSTYEEGYPKGSHLHCSCLTLGEIRSSFSPWRKLSYKGLESNCIFLEIVSDPTFASSHSSYLRSSFLILRH